MATSNPTEPSAADARLAPLDEVPPPWPDGAALAVSFVVNVEEGAELSLGDADERNESLHEIDEEVHGAPDLCLRSHFAYGPRAGYRRIVAAFEREGVVATFSCCGRAAERLPWLLRDASARGHELAAHGWRWERHAGMDEATERAAIARTAIAIERASGLAPRGWHTRSSASVRTRQLLVEHGGFAYDSDAYDDDVPRIEMLGAHAHVVLPYAFDTNDMRFAPGAGFVHAGDFSRYVLAAFERLLAEGREAARMLSIGLHLRTIGRPARIGALEEVLATIASRPDVWCATRGAIAARWREANGLPAFAPRDRRATADTDDIDGGERG